MNSRATLAVVLLFSLSALLPARADDNDDTNPRWWHNDGGEDYRAGPCEVKIDEKPGELKREIKCKDGVGASWSGEWKEEYWEGPCKVKREASREVFKEEVKCEGRR